MKSEQAILPNPCLEEEEEEEDLHNLLLRGHPYTHGWRKLVT
jgi:hypothetical protein